VLIKYWIKRKPIAGVALRSVDTYQTNYFMIVYQNQRKILSASKTYRSNAIAPHLTTVGPENENTSEGGWRESYIELVREKRAARKGEKDNGSRRGGY